MSANALPNNLVGRRSAAVDAAGLSLSRWTETRCGDLAAGKQGLFLQELRAIRAYHLCSARIVIHRGAPKTGLHAESEHISVAVDELANRRGKERWRRRSGITWPLRTNSQQHETPHFSSHSSSPSDFLTRRFGFRASSRARPSFTKLTKRCANSRMRAA